jgi:hypothetical protein
LDRIADCLHVLHTQVVWTTQPHAIDLRSSNHLLDRIETPCVADAKLSSPGGSDFSVRRVWTVHTKHIRIANATPGFKVKLRDEAAADEADSQFSSCHNGRSLATKRHKRHKI